VEQRRQAKLKAERDARERQRIAEQKRQAQLEAKRKAEEAKRKAAEAKRKAEQQRKADEARRQRENLEMMRQQMAQEEQQRAAAARKRQLLALESKYVTLIQQKVTRNWIRPPTAHSGMSCTVHVRLIPGGEVVEATTVKSSGDPAFDRSAETAVLKASPLPPPPDPALFQREFNFVFKPEG
ncbi:MAG: cell envelope integrity protein TolA, partial [Gammaproteobacteria bacterium]